MQGSTVTTESKSVWDGAFARRTRGAGSEITAILALAGAADVIAFSGGFPAPETFPGAALAGVAGDLFLNDARRALQYAPTPGLPGLRQAMLDRLDATQGRRPEAGELLVTSGGIDALALIGKAMLDQGDLVAVEAPTYLGAITAFRGFEAELCEVAVGDDGLDVEALGVLLARGPVPKFLYTIPDHQNPTGLTMSAERRDALVDICRRHGVLVVEDVAYRELGSGAEAAPSLWSLGPDVVVQIGTFSKTLFPGVRLGWAVGPAAIVAEMVTAKQNSDQCAGALGVPGRGIPAQRGLRPAAAPFARHLRRPASGHAGGPRSPHARWHEVDGAERRLLHLGHLGARRRHRRPQRGRARRRRGLCPGGTFLCRGRPRYGPASLGLQRGDRPTDLRGRRAPRSSLPRRVGEP